VCWVLDHYGWQFLGVKPGAVSGASPDNFAFLTATPTETLSELNVFPLCFPCYYCLIHIRHTLKARKIIE
jgi:hypothetical protein